VKLNFLIGKIHIIEINKYITSKELEPHGILGSNLDFALSHIKNNYLENDLEKLSFLIININNGHSFIEGNKRTSIYVLIEILISNKYILYLSKKEIVNLALDISQNKYNTKKLSNYLKNNIIDFDLCFEKLSKIKDEEFDEKTILINSTIQRYKKFYNF
jgi:death-on-curing family protein